MTQYSDSKSSRAESLCSIAQTDRDELLAEIEKGEKAIHEGRTLSHEEAKKRMSRWLREESAGEA
jgi:predicted transcriptional regulator